MKNYYNADLMRIRKKHGHLIWLALIYVIIAAIAFMKCTNEAGYVEFADLVAGSLPAYLGLIVFFAVFSDDTKTRTMQVAIGRGLTRNQVLFSKVLEGLTLTVVYFALSGLVLSVIPLIVHVSISGASYLKLWGAILESILSMMFYFNIGLILIVATLKSNLAEIVYILFAFAIIPGALNVGFAFASEKLGWPNLLPYLYGNLISSFLQNPLANLGCLLGGAVYLATTLFIAAETFQKKELEF